MTSTRGAKAGRKEEEASTSEDFASLTKYIKDLSKDVKEFKKDSKAMQASIAQVAEDIGELHDFIKEHDSKIKELERTVEAHDSLLDVVQTDNLELKKSRDLLLKKVADLEARNRRNNLRIINLEEGTESGQLSEFFAGFLREVFGQDLLPTPPEVDRAHRSFISKPTPGAKPRSIILCLHRFQIKDQLLRESRRRGTLNYRGQNIRIVDDYPPEVMKERSTYKEVMFQLYSANLKPSLRYPARLRITLPDDTKKWLSSPKTAADFLKDYRPVSVDE